MKSHFSLKGGWLIGTLLLSAMASDMPDGAKDIYVPVPCPLSLLRIVDWGKCHTAGDAWDCPAAHIAFRTDCVAKKSTGKVEFRLNVDRPTVLIDDKQGDSAQK